MHPQIHKHMTAKKENLPESSHPTTCSSVSKPTCCDDLGVPTTATYYTNGGKGGRHARLVIKPKWLQIFQDLQGPSPVEKKRTKTIQKRFGLEQSQQSLNL